MRTHLMGAALIWAIVTATSVAVIYLAFDPFPVQGSAEADFLDEAFFAMTYMAAPIFGLVVAVLAYGVLRFRSSGPGAGDGPAITGTGSTAWIPKVWFVASAVLAVVIMIYPGLTGLAELRSDKTSDLDVKMTAFRFGWFADYPEQQVRSQQELVLPAHTRIRFDIQGLDVLHSFWVPAFRLKMDAVPGRTTTLYLTTTDPGSPETDSGYRVQCAELCGLLHARMTIPVRVVPPDEFAQWLTRQQALTRAQ